MAFPQDSLAKGEEVKEHLHPHWKMMIMPTFWTALAVAAVAASLVLALVFPVFIGVSVLAGILFLWKGFAPFVVWRSTHYVITNEQVLFRSGVFSRENRAIALARISDVKFNQSLLERMLGCGTLTVESAGEHGQTALTDIPHVERVTLELRQLVKADEDGRTLDDSELREIIREERAPAPRSDD